MVIYDSAVLHRQVMKCAFGLSLISTYLCGLVTSQGVSQVRAERALPHAPFTRQDHDLVLHGGQLQPDLLDGFQPNQTQRE